MSEMSKTVVFVLVAAGLAATAYLTRPQVNRDVSQFHEEREPFYPSVQPDQVKGLEVTGFDKDTGGIDSFSVKLQDGVWIIPSHNNYPADAEKRLKETAGAVLTLQKDAVIPGGKERHKECAVIDPTDPEGDAASWGTRIKLLDENSNAVCDLIIGKDVPDKADYKFVRVPDRDRVYQVKCTDLDVSTRFADWINTDLITDSSFDFDRIEIKDYRAEIAGNRLRLADQGVINCVKDDQSKWQVEGLAEGEATNETKVADVATAISDLAILGVRPKPPGLTPDLNIIEQQFALESMVGRGFIPTEDGRLISKDGEVVCETKDGIRYTLRFGRVIVGRGDEVEIGTDDEKGVDAPTDPDKKAEDAENADPEKAKDDATPETQENRFLLISVAFNEDRFPPIEAPAEPTPAEEPAAEPADEKAEPPTDADAPKEEAPAEPAPESEPAPAEPETPAETPAEPPAEESVENVVYQESDEPASDQEPAEEPAEPAPKASEEPAPADEPPAEDAPAAETPTGENADPAKAAADAEAQFKAEQAKAEFERQKADRERKIEAGKKKAAELEQRYGQWFYVVSNESAQKVRVNRADLVQKEEPKEDSGNAPAEGDVQPPAPPVDEPPAAEESE